MRTLSHSTQWRKGPYCLTSLIVKAAHISEPACQGPGFIFFFLLPFSPFPFSLFELFFPFSLFHPLSHTLSYSFNTHFPAPSFFSLPSPHHLSPLPLSLPPSLSLSVSPFSKWWVLTYDRLSQVCFNYCKGDGDSTGEEEGKTFVRTLYLRSGG